MPKIRVGSGPTERDAFDKRTASLRTYFEPVDGIDGIQTLIHVLSGERTKERSRTIGRFYDLLEWTRKALKDAEPSDHGTKRSVGELAVTTDKSQRSTDNPATALLLLFPPAFLSST